MGVAPGGGRPFPFATMSISFGAHPVSYPVCFGVSNFPERLKCPEHKPDQSLPS
jgi:hypothetical protein